MINAFKKYLPSLLPAFVVLLALAAASCSSDDIVADNNEDSADDCVELRAEVVSSPVTRSQTALQSTWSVDDEMAIQNLGDSKFYRYKVKDASTGELIEYSEQPRNFMLWRAGESVKRLHAWSYGGIYEGTLPTSRAFGNDQSIPDAFQAQDFLYCPPTDVLRNGTYPSRTLMFRHAMTRVHVFVRADADEGVTAVNEVKLQAKLTGTFNYTSDNMAWLASGAYAIVTPLQMNTAGTGYLSAHTAILVPQAMGGSNALLQVKAVKGGEEKTYRYTPPTTNGVDILRPGVEYLLYVSFTSGTVQVSVVQLTSDWASSNLSGQIIAKGDMPVVGVGNWSNSNGNINTGNNSSNGNIGTWVGDPAGNIDKDDNGTTQDWQQDADGDVVKDSNDAPSSIGTIGNWVQGIASPGVGYTGNMPYSDVNNWTNSNGNVNTGDNSSNGNTQTWTGDPDADTEEGTGATQDWTGDPDANTEEGSGATQDWQQDGDGDVVKDSNDAPSSIGTVGNWVEGIVSPGVGDTGKMPYVVVGNWGNSNGNVNTGDNSSNGNTQTWTGDPASNIDKDENGSMQDWQKDGDGNIVKDNTDAPSSIGSVGNWVQFDPSSTVYAIFFESHMPTIGVGNWVQGNGSINTADGSSNGNTKDWTADPEGDTEEGSGSTQDWTGDPAGNTEEGSGSTEDWTGDGDGDVTKDGNGTVSPWQNSNIPVGEIQEGTPPSN